MIYRGYNVSGLEFGTSFPGTSGIDYFQSAQGLFNYIASKGGNVVRIPFKWERLQPSLNGSINSTYQSQLDDQITKASNAGLKVILDCHNYGRLRVTSAGGFTDTFASSSSINFSGSYTISGGVLTGSQWNRVSGGHLSNPVSPKTSYKMTVDAKITSNGGSDVWRELWIEVYRISDNYRYFFVMNNLNSVIRLYKVVNGVQTEIQSKSFTINLNTFYTIVIDVGQTTPGTISVKVNGTTQLSGSTDAGLTSGQVAFYGSGVNWAIDNFTLDVGGDTTNGGTVERTMGAVDGIVTSSHFADFWQKVSNLYKNNATVIGYDLMNEFHDMPVATTSSNYKTTATATVMHQAAVNAIRANNDSKYIIIELDHWANIHYFTTEHGTNPDPWITDATGNTIYSAHSYWDSDHSGTYTGGWDSDARLYNLHEEVLPFFDWCKNKGVKCFIGEFGTPSDDDRWLSPLYTFYKYMDDYDVWGSAYWALGDAYVGPVTSIQPTSSYTVDLRQMQVCKLFSGGNHAPYISGKKLKFQSVSTMTWSKDSMRGHTDAGGGYTLAQIDGWMSLIKQLGCTHVDIDCPMDERADYPAGQDIDTNGGIGYLTQWIAKARKYGLNILYRGTFCEFEAQSSADDTVGLYGFSRKYYNLRLPGVKTQDVTTITADTWLKKVYTFLVNHATLFQENDIFAPYPEPTSWQFGAHATWQSNVIMSQFYFDLKVVSDIVFAQQGIRGVYTGMSSDIYDQLASGYIDTIFYRAANEISVDYYNSNATTWINNLVTLYNSKSFLGTKYKMFIEEFGDIYNSSPTDNPARATLVNQYLQGVDANLSKFNGINYWAAPSALINDSLFTLTQAGSVVQSYFGGTSSGGTTTPPVGTSSTYDLKPSMKIQRTNALINNPGITYNENGVTYSDARYTYGGIYGNDIVPINAKIRR